MGSENEGSASRRRFLAGVGAVGVAGLGGCLDAEDGRPTPERTSEGGSGEATLDRVSATPPPREDVDGPSWQTTLFAAWRGTDPTRSITLQWLTGAETKPEPTPVTLNPHSGGSATTVETDVAPFEAGGGGPNDDADHVTVDGDDRGGEIHGLLRFEDVVGSGDGRVPPGSDIEAATLTVTAFDPGDGADVHRVLEPWEPEAIWSDFGADGITADGTVATSDPVTEMDDVTQRTTEIDVTGALQAWADGEANHGIVLLPTGEDGFEFHSTAGETPPALSVTTADGTTYTFQQGVEGYDGTVDTYLHQTVQSTTGLYRHRAEPTDLAPDTAYAITVDGTEAGALVRTAPETFEEPLTVAEGGDIGTSDAVPALHGRASGWDPLFGFVGGDLAYANAVNLDRWVHFLEDWSEHMRSGDRLIPMVAAIGNHETPGGGGSESTPADAPFYYTLFDNTRGEHAYWSLDVGEDISIVVLDSGLTTDVTGEQTAWLEETLAERQDRTHLMAAYHTPAYPSTKPIGWEVRNEMRDNWVPLFEEYGVDVAFEHDDHTYKRTHPLSGGEPAEDGVLYVGDGAWGRGPREAKSPEERPYLARSAGVLNVIRVDLVPDGTREFRAVDPDGAVIDEFSTQPPVPDDREAVATPR